MFRPQDSDIFGTKSERVIPRIVNNEKVDPNSQFQKNMDAQYERYAGSVIPRNRASVSQSQVALTKVNEQANFEEHYHHNRKELDLQSSIFYEPTLGNSRMSAASRITHREVPKHAYNVKDGLKETNFGRKETLTREVSNQPDNKTEFKGNCSSVFGYDEKADRNMVKNKIEKLIPYQMQWDEHDSIKNQDAVDPKNKTNPLNIQESKSTVFEKPLKPHNDENSSRESNKQPKQETTKTQIPDKKMEKPKEKEDINGIEIMILKGWNSNMLEGLSKCCRINNTKILAFQSEAGGKGTLTLSRSKRWETVSDWLRKDCGLKMRVKN